MTNPVTYSTTVAKQPLVYHGWKCIIPEMALVVNMPTEPYQCAAPRDTLPYDWTRKDG